MSTFAERVGIAMEARGLGHNELGRLIGKKPGYVSALISENRTPRADNVEALARALRVRLEWLLRGDEPMDLEMAPTPITKPANPERFVEYDQRYPNLGAAIVWARADGISETAIERVRNEAYSMDEDPHPRIWLRRIEDEAVKVRREELGLRQDVEREHAARARDHARVEEMKKATKPKLPKRKGRG